MPTLKLHYDGWIALPAALRQTLSLSSGDRLTADLVNGALVLRPATKSRAGRGVNKSADAAAPTELTSDTLALVDESKTTVKVRRTPKSASLADVAKTPKRRGRPRKARAAVETSALAHPVVGIGPAKLVKKAELEIKAAPQEQPLAPAARIRPDRISQPVERRPFRNVEIRSLGPARGRGRRQLPSGSVA